MILLKILFGLFQILLLLALAPLVQGIIKKVKALFQSRKGPSIFQPYFDLIKLLRKDQVVSEHASWIFHITPYISLISVLVAGALIPVIGTTVPWSFAGDVIVVVYLFALMRFFMALVGLDTGSAFGGMASSREMTIASLAEPALLLSLLT
ncbi:MAG: NADH-quinone oxidoreductase subunit H, partial [Nitrospira sp.]|nr:NADH-quinone oxidoreductase subunit H [Nitrospira sp.]